MKTTVLQHPESLRASIKRELPGHIHRIGSLSAFLIMAFLGSSSAQAQVKVWTCDIVLDERSPKVVKELKPVTLVGARNGAFSGKIVVESTRTIKGLKASVDALTGQGGIGIIPASCVQIRYASAWDSQARGAPKGLDILLDSPPEVAPGKGPALLPVWVTVNVPKDARAGTYEGEVSVGGTKVKLILEVADWTLPDPQDYRTWTDFVQSPDAVALEYNVPLWSEKHWELIDRSFRVLSPTGCRVLYVPLITRTNFGNEQSMVRWIPKGNDQYDYDYTVLDRYLDSAEKNLGKPKLVIFLVWDICMSEKSLERGIAPYMQNYEGTKEGRTALLGKGPRVSALDPVTKEVGDIFLPRYEDKASRALWEPMFSGVIERMKKRGLEKTMMLGTMPDLWPNKEEVAFWNGVAKDLPWVIHAHGGPIKDVVVGQKALHKIADIAYAACVSTTMYNVNPEKGRMYGWKNPALTSSYLRFELNNDSPAFIREFQVFNITGDKHGAGRMGADLWPSVRNKQGERAGMVYERYPENNWRNLDMRDWFLAPGPDGAVATARMEYLREGTEICELRIFLEETLLDPSKQSRIGDALAQRCQDALDEHHRMMWKTVWFNDEDLKSIGKIADGRNPQEALYTSLLKNGTKLPPDYWHDPGASLRREQAAKGEEEFVAGWQERERKLFMLAGEVASALGLYRFDKPGIQATSKPKGPDSAPAAQGSSGRAVPQAKIPDWPAEVVLLQKTTFPIVMGGKSSGSFIAQPGTVVRLVSAGTEVEVEVEFQGARVKLPAGHTDLAARMAELHKGDAQKQSAP